MLIIKDKFLYIALIVTNLIGNVLFKILSVSAIDLLFYRYIFLFIICFICIIYFIFIKRVNKSSLNFYIRNCLPWSLLRVVTTFCAMWADLQQIKHGSFINTTLIYCSIPFFDMIIYNIFNKINLQFFLLSLFSNLSILFYNTILFSYQQYIYGYMASLFFSFSNILFLMTKKKLNNNNQNILLVTLFDLSIFSFLMSCLNVLIFGGANIGVLTFDLSLLSLLGVCITVIIYFLFFVSTYNPSFIISNLDLFLSLLVDITIFRIYPNGITIFVSVLMLYTLYQRYVKTYK